VFLGNGDGTFQTFVPYTETCGGTAVAADFNGDGKLDLAVGDLCVLLGKGDGTFTLGTGSGSGAGAIAIGDFNGDGKLDVANLVGAVYLGNGDGTFQTPTPATFATNSSGTLPFGDFNRDGQLDLAIWGSSAIQIGLQTSLRVTPVSLSFGSHKVGTTSAKQPVTLTDVGAKSLPITSIAITGTNAGDFSQQNNCGVGLQAGKSCTANVVFKPTATGARSATLTITYSGVDTPQTVALSGTGT
jgi:Abnormal spindle-like microcephaly-assoc'd, ASPM-SPD-2-Hydin/FG-GAP-like repeat